jgi:hypothetical protein
MNEVVASIRGMIHSWFGVAGLPRQSTANSEEKNS